MNKNNPKAVEMKEQRGIEIALLEKTGNRTFAKSYDLRNGRELAKVDEGNAFGDMTARRLTLNARHPLQDLKQIIGGIGQNAALALGALPPEVGDKALPVAYKRRHQSGQAGGTHRVDYITRTGEDFTFRPGVPAPVLLDFDEKDYPQHIRDMVEKLGGPLEALIHAVPELVDVEMLVRPSTSSGITRESDGHVFGVGGVHAYLMLADGSLSAEFLKRLEDRVWEARLGFLKVTKAGSVRNTSIIDASVGRSERPVFEAPPVLGEGLVQAERACEIRDGNKALVDLEDVASADVAEVASLVNDAKAAGWVQEAVGEAKGKKVQELVDKGIDRAMANRQVDAMQGGKLPLALSLEPMTQKPGDILKVIDLLEKPADHDQLSMADPVEGAAYNNRQTAMFFANSGGTPIINSQAHGGILYRLSGYGPQDAVEAVQDGLDLGRVVMVLRLDVEAVRNVFDALGVAVCEEDRERIIKLAGVASISRKATAVMPFAAEPPPGTEQFEWNETRQGAFVAGLRDLAEGRSHGQVVGSDVDLWLNKQKERPELIEQPETAKGFQSSVSGGVLRVKTLTDYVREQPKRESVVRPMGLYRGTVNTLTALPNGGKTATAIELLFVVGLGETLHGRKIRRQRVLYFSGENDVDNAARVRLTARDRGVKLEDVDADMVAGAFPFADHADAVLRHMKGQEYALVIIDTAMAFFGGDNENDNAEMQKYYASFRRVANGPGTPCVLILTHPSGDKATLSPERQLLEMRPRGATSVWGTIDSNTNQVLDRKTGIVRSHLHKVRGRPMDDLHWRLKPLSDPSVLDGDGEVEEAVRLEPISAAQADFTQANDDNRVLEEISRNPKASLKALADALGEAKTTIHSTVKRLERKGWVETEPGGKGKSVVRRLTPEGQRQVQPAVPF